jgi:fructose/tagatose bisphosphate aldolase
MDVSSALREARHQRRAIGAFNVYTIDQAAAVIDAAEQLESPPILQAHPSGRDELLWPRLAALRVIGDTRATPAMCWPPLERT